MILENQTVEIQYNRIRKENRELLLNKGYVPQNNIIRVDVKDLPITVKALIDISCDYCGNTIKWQYRKAIEEKRHCCKYCISKKRKEVFLEKYGVENPSQIKEVQDKIRRNLLETYGVVNVGQIAEIKEKVKSTLLDKYGVTNAYQLEKVRKTTLKNHGVEYPFQSPIIREKQCKTMFKRYGVMHPSSNPKFIENMINNNIKKYGVKTPSQLEEIKEKATINMLKVMYKNGTIQTSSQQRHIHALLGGELNYAVDRCSLDIAFLDSKIYIEYNGGGHYVWPKINGMSETAHHKKEMSRYHFLKSQGWKLIKIVSKSDILYSDDMIVLLVNDCKSYLNQTNHHWIEINIDSNLIKCSEYIKSINT